MRFRGTETECAEVIAELDAALGYPRGYTQADLDDGTIVRVGGGVHVPLDMLRTETIAAPVLDGDEHALDLRGLRNEHRQRVGRKRVLRLLNRGSRAALMAVPGIGGTRADAIIARRAQGRLTSIEDLRDALPALVVQALRDYALTRVGDDDQDEAT